MCRARFFFGSRSGPVGQANVVGFAAGQSKGYTPIPNGKPNLTNPLPVLQVEKFMMAGEKWIMQNFGPGQDIAFDAIVGGMGKPWFAPYRHLVEKRQVCGVLGLFIHGAAVDTKKIRE